MDRRPARRPAVPLPAVVDYYLAWWNLENLFDVQNAPGRPAWLQKQLAGELKG